MMCLTSSQRWFPKPENRTLDNLKADELPLFRYAVVRNGCRVALYVGIKKAEEDVAERKFRFPLDDWAIVDRQNGGAA